MSPATLVANRRARPQLLTTEERLEAEAKKLDIEVALRDPKLCITDRRSLQEKLDIERRKLDSHYRAKAALALASGMRG